MNNDADRYPYIYIVNNEKRDRPETKLSNTNDCVRAAEGLWSTVK